MSSRPWFLIAPCLAACAAAPPPGAVPRADLAFPAPATRAAGGLAETPLAGANFSRPGLAQDVDLGGWESRAAGRPAWVRGTAVLQGYLGATVLEKLERGGGSAPAVDGSDESSSRFPTIGGGAQWKLAGERVDLGLEGLLGFGGRANGGAFVAGGGGAVVAVDVDLLLFELYGGPFLSVFLGERLRAYVAAGPVMQWASYDQEGPTPAESADGIGFGTGYYARTGLELRTSTGTLVGLGVRWLDSSIDLGGGLGDLDAEGYQVVLTVTRGF